MTKWAIRDMMVGATMNNDKDFFCKCYKVALRSKLMSQQERRNMYIMFLTHYMN